MPDASHPQLTPWLPTILSFGDQGMAVAIGLFSTEGRLHYANAGMRHLLGHDERVNVAELFKVPIFETLKNNDAAHDMVYQGWITFGSRSVPHRSVKGRVFRRETSLLVVAEHDIEALENINHQIMTVNREITNLQRELARQKAELIQLNKLKNEFMGIAAHDLRSPLSVIQGFSSLLTRHPDMPKEERLELLTMISDSIKDMIEMLNSLLNVSEIESGNLRLNPVEVNLDDYLHHIAQRSRHTAEQKNITLHLDIEPGLLPVRFDPHRIQQVMDNLLSNAFKFSHRDTQVIIRCVRISAQHIEISVIDQGQGIKTEELSKVFLAFQKTSTRSTAGEHSTGLGLAICKRIVELSGGQIGVESVYGQGSRFFFSLPLTAQYS
jgi:signal transduction histidine kinase